MWPFPTSSLSSNILCSFLSPPLISISTTHFYLHHSFHSPPLISPASPLPEPMAISERSLIRVLRLPELFNVIVQYLSPKDVLSLRLVNTLFLDHCAAHFSITLDLECVQRYPDLKKFAESALAIEGAAMASTGRTDKVDREQSSPLDLIQSLKISRGRSLHRSLTPDIVSILNQCGNLRHIHVNDDPPSTTEFPEKQSYPARLLWSSMFPVDQGGEGGAGGGVSEDDEQHWTFWDLLPLEGFLFDRLESLTIDVGYNTQLNLDRFMTRLGRSGVAKSLRALTITSSTSARKVSWDVFQNCICNLSVLKMLRVHFITITYIKDPRIDTGDGSQQRMVTRLQHVAPTVKSLNCRLGNSQDSDVRLAFMSLFPNVESLELTDLDYLLDKSVEERIYSEVGCHLPQQQSPLRQQYSSGFVEGNDSPSRLIPFPHLRSLECRDFSTRDWADSQVFRHWIQRTPNFRLSSLRVNDQDVDSSLHEELFACSVSLAYISIKVSQKDYVKDLLSSPLCRNLEILGFDNAKLDCASVLESTTIFLSQAGSSPPSQPSISDVPLLRQQDHFTLLPWTQTLTTIRFQTLPHSSSGSGDEGGRSVAILRSFLKLLPCLVAFEVVDPIMDLSIFEGIGRQVTMSSVDDPTDTDMTLNDLLNSDQEEESGSYQSERPWLTRLKVCQSQYSKDRIADRYVSDRLAPWRRQLQFQFRFLETLILDRERVYTGNGGYDPSNFGSSIDWDLYYD
ncbi:MAG: hypothetical protein JOS17DRAFT_468800 [Linnemannia elongata]|nr:MAG: hypothetical protein JOS17DRAFT_468800 [Linnemannia elongata]